MPEHSEWMTRRPKTEPCSSILCYTVAIAKDPQAVGSGAVASILKTVKSLDGVAHWLNTCLGYTVARNCSEVHISGLGK